MKTIKELCENLEKCDYTCEAGPLKMNVDYTILKNTSIAQQLKLIETVEKLECTLINLESIIRRTDKTEVELAKIATEAQANSLKYQRGMDIANSKLAEIKKIYVDPNLTKKKFDKMGDILKDTKAEEDK